MPHARLITVSGANHWTTMADRSAQAALRDLLDDIADPAPGGSGG